MNNYINAQLITQPQYQVADPVLSVDRQPCPALPQLVIRFIDYIKYEEVLSNETAIKYKDSMKWLQIYLSHIVYPSDIKLEDITTLKKKMIERGCGPARVNNIIFALRKFLGYCQKYYQLATLNPKEIKPMRIPKRQVEFLNNEEIQQLLESINTKDKRGLRMRALMELLLATGMRISEALSLNKKDINWDSKEALIIGKGNKERSIYLTDRALGWIKKYLDMREDSGEPLFVTFGKLTRLTRYDLSKQFKHYTKVSGLTKRVTPHTLRHTMATMLLRNGCDIRYIQEMLGHEDIETTARYYLGTDKRSVKEAHAKYLQFG